MLLEGGLDWKAMSLSPRDMDFIEARHAAAREIALALGVPPMLLGIPGDNTYANYQANRASGGRRFCLSSIVPPLRLGWGHLGTERSSSPSRPIGSVDGARGPLVPCRAIILSDSQREASRSGLRTSAWRRRGAVRLRTTFDD